jgi:hypothetical protein
MNFKIEFYPDKSYYKEAYEEIISTYKFKKWEPIFAILFFVFGISIYFINQTENLIFFPSVFIVIGIYEFFKFYNEKRKWIKDRLNSKVFEKKLELEFEEEYLIHSGPFSKGKINWNGINDILKTKKGILIKPETGISIYLSEKVFKSKSEIDFIISKKK